MKYAAIASGAVNLVLLIAAYLLLSNLNSTKIKLGKAEAVAAANKQVADNARTLYADCDADRVRLVNDHNAAIERMADAAAKQQAAAAQVASRSASSIARLEAGLSSLGATPIGGSCEARLVNVAAQLEAYRKVVISAQ